MEKRILKSMVDYVLEQQWLESGTPNVDYSDRLQSFNKITNYARFLSMPLTIEMFVPCKLVDGVWIPLENPNNDYVYHKFKSNELYLEADKEYQKALDDVIFKDAVIIDESPYKSTKRFMVNLKHSASFRIYNKFNFHDGYEEIEFLPNFSKKVTVEYMVGYDLELNQSAITKFQI